MRDLRSILGNRWRDIVTGLEVLDRAHSTSIEPMLIKTNSDGWIISSACQEVCCKKSSFTAKERSGKKDTVKSNLQEAQAHRTRGVHQGSTILANQNPRCCCHFRGCSTPEEQRGKRSTPEIIVGSECDNGV